MGFLPVPFPDERKPRNEAMLCRSGKGIGEGGAGETGMQMGAIMRTQDMSR